MRRCDRCRGGSRVAASDSRIRCAGCGRSPAAVIYLPGRHLSSKNLRLGCGVATRGFCSGTTRSGSCTLGGRSRWAWPRSRPGRRKGGPPVSSGIKRGDWWVWVAQGGGYRDNYRIIALYLIKG
jgi:hypothetical protein